MNIQYRIVKVDPEAHGVVIRYFTDKVTEMDLANSFNPDGTIKLNADGYPLSTRTDIMMSIYDTPTPDAEELDKRIMLNAPVDWLQLQENIKDPAVDTKMKHLRDLIGDSKTFTVDDIKQLRGSIETEAQPTPEQTEEAGIQKADDTVVNLMDSLKVLADKDPAIIQDFADNLKNLRKLTDL